MAKRTNKTEIVDRTQLDRYRPVRTVAMRETVSFSDRGSLAISVDLMESWPKDKLYVVIYATPKTRSQLFLEPGGPDDVGSLKLPCDTNGSAKANGKAVIHQFGLDDVAGVRRCRARWVDGLIVADIEGATIVPRRSKARKPETPAADEGPSAGWVGKMKCADCGKEVAYRIIAGCRVTRAHKAPDGLPCGGVVDDDD
jgi:hypothetical protein